jgi:hypothetical protein
MKTISLLSVGLLAVIALGACSKAAANDMKLGEPVGVRVETEGASTLEAAFAAKQGVDGAQMVPAFATALGKAAKACPKVPTELGSDSAARLKGKIEGGKLKMEKPGGEVPGSVDCIAKALDGTSIAGQTVDTPLVIELRVAKKEGSK